MDDRRPHSYTNGKRLIQQNSGLHGEQDISTEIMAGMTSPGMCHNGKVVILTVVRKSETGPHSAELETQT